MVNCIKFENKCLNRNCNNILDVDCSKAFCLACNLEYTISIDNNILEIFLDNYISNIQVTVIYFIYIMEYGFYAVPSMPNINLINEVICDLNIVKAIDIKDVINNLYNLNKLAKKIIDLEIFE